MRYECDRFGWIFDAIHRQKWLIFNNHRDPVHARNIAVIDPGKSAPIEREIPLDAITGTVEPSRALQFDHAFRPAPPARTRWERVWMAEHLGAVLPPISVVQVGCCDYAVRDGHHRVSVTRARGALTIDAVVDAI